MVPDSVDIEESAYVRPSWVPAILAVNLGSGMLLLFFVFTDYSWIGRYPDLVFGPLVGIVAILSTLILRASRVLVHQRAYLLGLVPSLIAGGVAPHRSSALHSGRACVGNEGDRCT